MKKFSDQSEFLNFLQEREENTAWKRAKTKELRFMAIEGDGTSNSFRDIMDEFEKNAQREVLEDTIKNTCLLLRQEEMLYPVRNCAVKTILERARIGGGALSQVKKTVLANILNECIKVGKGSALLKINDNKVSAIHAGDKCDYVILNMPELFQIAVEYLEKEFTGYEFQSAIYDHSLVTVYWNLPKYRELLDLYEQGMEKTGRIPKDIQPAIRMTTSDTGISGANLFPALIVRECSVPIGNPLRLEHKNQASMMKFTENLHMIFAQFQKAMKGITHLLTIEINNPTNTMIGIMKRIGIPKKYGAEAVEIFKNQFHEEICTAHDVYFGIAEAVYMLQCFGGTPVQVAQMEENIARALTLKWQEYDMPGMVSW